MKYSEIISEEKVRLDPKCWSGKKIGNPKTKMKGGVRVNNCVPAESVSEHIDHAEYDDEAGMAHTNLITIARAAEGLLDTIDQHENLPEWVQEKIAKAEADKFATLSEVTTGEGDLAKLKNQFSNYAIRNAFYYVLAPQAGQITKTISAGIGEVVKEGEMMVKIVPQKFQYAVEMYVKPMDLPLISLGQTVRFQFDGWPAIVFSGWPNVSYGTYGGTVVAIDNTISENGKFRILVAENTAERKWPDALKVGGGARGMALLKDVTIIYELWRNMNGFPPDFYKLSDTKKRTGKNED